MSGILSHVGNTYEHQTEVTLESTPYEKWYYVSREGDDGVEYYSAHDNGKHVYFTEPNQDLWNWEMWTVERVSLNDETYRLMKSTHGTFIYMDYETGYIWQTNDISEIPENDLITLNITDAPDFTPSDAPQNESDEEESDLKLLPPSQRQNKTASGDSDDSETKKPRGRPKKSSDNDEPKTKRKPNIKLLAFQAYCKDNRAKVKEESPEAKLGEQQKILGEWWKHEEEDTHTKYERMVSQKLEENE
jgi:hypothetical protein